MDDVFEIVVPIAYFTFAVCVVFAAAYAWRLLWRPRGRRSTWVDVGSRLERAVRFTRIGGISLVFIGAVVAFTGYALGHQTVTIVGVFMMVLGLPILFVGEYV